MQRRALKPRLPRTVSDGIDYSMFTDEDVANLILQRSEIVGSRAAIVAWEAGIDEPLRQLARSERWAVLTGAMDRLRARCDVLNSVADAAPPRRVADIGCGYGMASLLLHRRYGCDVALIDIEHGTDRHFGFKDSAAAYADLSTARAFLEANGVPRDQIITVNPENQSLADIGEVDLAFSLLSCGFHYPTDIYADFFHDHVAPEGRIVLDIRRGSGGIRSMKKFGKLSVIGRDKGLATILVEKKPEFA